MPELDARRREFEALNAQVLDISVDSIASHAAWRRKEIGPVNVPLCADFYPHAEVTRMFGILREGPPVASITAGSSSDNIGGIAGKNKGTILDSYAIVTLDGNDDIGGIENLAHSGLELFGAHGDSPCR